jgi:hypothetical protein
MFHAKKGFAKLQPKTKEELDAEKALADFEAGKYGAPVKAEEKPKPEEKPTPPPTPKPDESDEEIARLARIRRGFGKLAPGGK